MTARLFAEGVKRIAATYKAEASTPEAAIDAAELGVDAAALFLAATIGTEKAAERCYQLADYFACYPQSETERQIKLGDKP